MDGGSAARLNGFGRGSGARTESRLDEERSGGPGARLLLFPVNVLSLGVLLTIDFEKGKRDANATVKHVKEATEVSQI